MTKIAKGSTGHIRHLLRIASRVPDVIIFCGILRQSKPSHNHGCHGSVPLSNNKVVKDSRKKKGWINTPLETPVTSTYIQEYRKKKRWRTYWKCVKPHSIPGQWGALPAENRGLKSAQWPDPLKASGASPFPTLICCIIKKEFTAKDKWGFFFHTRQPPNNAIASSQNDSHSDKKTLPDLVMSTPLFHESQPFLWDLECNVSFFIFSVGPLVDFCTKHFGLSTLLSQRKKELSWFLLEDSTYDENVFVNIMSLWAAG